MQFTRNSLLEEEEFFQFVATYLVRMTCVTRIFFARLAGVENEVLPGGARRLFWGAVDFFGVGGPFFLCPKKAKKVPRGDRYSPLIVFHIFSKKPGLGWSGELAMAGSTVEGADARPADH